MNYSKKTFLFFFLPAFMAFVFVVVIPFFQGVIGSFTNWNSLVDSTGKEFVGFANYKTAIEDKYFIKTFVFTIEYALVAIILVNFVGLGLASLLNKAFKGRNIFRSLFFLPNLIGGLVLGYAWEILFTEGFESLGIQKWLTDTTNTFWALAIVTTWQYAGYMMIIYLAALQNVPKDQVEAVKISGGGPITVFRKVTIPYLMPAFTVAIFLTIARAVKVFSLILSLTKGLHQSNSVALNIYESVFNTTNADVNNYLGVAQAKAMIFTVFISSLAIIQVAWTKRREIRS